MNVTRRDMLAWGGGATVGLLVTPVPWKLMDDTAKWTQNWAWIPQPARGPVEVRNSFCTLCPQGCGMRVRLAGSWPVGVSGMPHHPVTQGALCPLGFGAHQLNWHPRRLRQVSHRGKAASWADALAAFRKACGEGPVALIDGYPRRAASSIFENFAQRQGGRYGVVRSAEERTLEPYAIWSGVPASSLGYDLEGARTIMSFGAPLLDGWGAPGRFTRLWSERAAGTADPDLRLIQVESSLSRTAGLAWRWVAIPPSSEAALAAGLARVLLEKRLVRAAGPIPPMTLADATAKTGLSAEAIGELARAVLERPPVLVIAADGNPAIAALNVVLGAVGARGGIVRREQARPFASAESLEGPFRAVLIDSSVPWGFTPVTDAEVFRFAAWEGGATRADWLLPAPGFLEELTDVPTAPAAAIETYAVAANLAPPAAGVWSAAHFLAQVDPTLPSIEEVVHLRCRDLFRSQAGSLQAEESQPVTGFGSPDKVEEALRNGAVWAGPAARSGGIRCPLKKWPEPRSMAPRRAIPWAGDWTPAVLPVLAAKLYQESSVREAPAGRAI